MSCQPHVPIFDTISIRIGEKHGKTLSRWSVSPCCLFRLQGHFSENRACRGDHHSVRRSFHESFFCGSSSKNGQTLGNDWVTKVHKHSWPIETYIDDLLIFWNSISGVFLFHGGGCHDSINFTHIPSCVEATLTWWGSPPWANLSFCKRRNQDVWRLQGGMLFCNAKNENKWKDWKQIKLPWLQIANRDSHLPAHLSTEILVHQGNLHGSRSLIW